MRYQSGSSMGHGLQPGPPAHQDDADKEEERGKHAGAQEEAGRHVHHAAQTTGRGLRCKVAIARESCLFEMF